MQRRRRSIATPPHERAFLLDSGHPDDLVAVGQVEGLGPELEGPFPADTVGRELKFSRLARVLAQRTRVFLSVQSAT